MRHRLRLARLARQAEEVRTETPSTFPGPWGGAQMDRRRAEQKAAAMLTDAERETLRGALARRDPNDPGVRWWGGPKAPALAVLVEREDGSLADATTEETAYSAAEWAVCGPVLEAGGKVLRVEDAAPLLALLGVSADEAAGYWLEDFSSSWAIHCLDGIDWPADAIIGGVAA